MELLIDWKAIGVLSGLFVTWSGFLVGIIKYLIERSLKAGDHRLEAIEQDLTDIKETVKDEIGVEADKRRELEREFRELIADLPLKYVQREDWIRLATGIDAKMDALAGKVDEVKDRLYARG
ncbi:hypothetical protein [Thalassospira alkalitolerans]|uniref:hypothetical protein n=1 Tax=Thalassospira alkalitolerans TaxID=1293890 RepID=UPI0030ECC0EE|tara:strand:+ start:3226 stop:3591 length:366 start_codon:yes stop_codon:yes gene_type:complete